MGVGVGACHLTPLGNSTSALQILSQNLLCSCYVQVYSEFWPMPLERRVY